MKLKGANPPKYLSRWIFVAFFALAISAFPSRIICQTDSNGDDITPTGIETAIAGNDDAGNAEFRVEKIRIEGGADLITIFGRFERKDEKSQTRTIEIPLVSVLRDTLGDTRAENDRFRYIWSLSYTRPSFAQKAASLVPFLYMRTTNKGDVGDKPPPPILELNPSYKHMWNSVFLLVLKKIAMSQVGLESRSSVMNYIQNASDYRRSSIEKALDVFALYDAVEGEKLLNDDELKEIQARLSVSGKFLGARMQPENLNKAYERERGNTVSTIGHNWELLRQMTEAQGLYFEPLEMPDGGSQNAIIWIAKDDLETGRAEKFDSRFLNIKNPWKDKSLKNWKGYTEDRWYDADNREFEPNTPGAKKRTMIPLAIYGLNHPKIPVILVDFRDAENPKRREVVKRVLDDVTKNFLSVFRAGDLPYFAGRFVFGLVTGRMGKDINQESRLRSYAQLKLLLTLNATLDPDFKGEIARRLERLSMNPMENDLDAEIRIANQQYENLVAYAKRPDGLPKQLINDRREEMVNLKHGGTAKQLFAVGHFLSFGLYTHREKETPDLLAELDSRRQLEYHEAFLRRVSFTSIQIEVDSDVNKIERSLRYIADHGAVAKAKTADAVAKLFAATENESLRDLCLSGLYRINNSDAKKQMLAIYKNPQTDEKWREVCARYLKQALKEGQRIAPADVPAITGIAIK